MSERDREIEGERWKVCERKRVSERVREGEGGIERGRVRDES